MARPVMVAVDGSQGSRAALRWGASLAEVLEAPLVAARSWRYPPAGGINPLQPTMAGPDEVDLLIVEDLRRILAEELGTAGDHADVVVFRGDAAHALLQGASGMAASLLVAGSRGLGGFRALLLGSVSRTVIDHATLPVAIVRGPKPVRGGKGGPIVVGVDGSQAASRAVTWAIEVGGRVDAELLLVHAFEAARSELDLGVIDRLRHNADRVLEEASDQARAAGMETRIEMPETDARDAILQIAEREGARMVVVGTRGLGAVTSMVLGSVAGHLAQHLPSVLIVVPPPDHPTPPA